MEALEALHTRNSVALLQEPAPDKQQLNNIFLAGLRASDHRLLRPWKFLLVEGAAREQLGKMMLEIALQDDPAMPAEKQGKLLSKPLRAPTIVVVVATIQTQCLDKVPEIEQILSAGGAAQLMLTAAHAQDLGAIWRSGAITHDERFKKGLGLRVEDRVVGLLYMGTAKAVKPLKPLVVEEFVQKWPALHDSNV